MNGLISHFRNGALMAVMAHGLVGISLVWDKVLLKKPGTKNLYSYVFWLGAMSIFDVVLVFFGYTSISLGMIGIAFAAGVLDLVGSYFYYAALKMGEASETLAIMGGFAPIATAGLSYALLSKQMTPTQLWGFCLMTTGGFVMFFAEDLQWKRILPPVLMASGSFGLVNVLEKIVYNQTNFVTGYVWFALGTFCGSMALLIPPSWRRQIFAESEHAEPSSRAGYFANRFINGLGSFLVFYAISLTHPAVVNAIGGVRYAVIFVGAYLLTKFKPSWLKENFSGRELVTKSLGTGFVVAGVIVVGLAGGKSTAGAWLNPRSIEPRRDYVAAAFIDKYHYPFSAR
jgi:drug/metabolite transporter (DMT)-like permease